MKKMLVIPTLILCLLLAFTACSMRQNPSQKPAPPKNQKTIPSPSDSTTKNRQTIPSPSDTTTPNKKPSTPAHTQASKLAQAAEEVEGVKAATVVVTGTTALVGLETDPNIEDKETSTIKKQVINEVKRADNSIKTVTITTDPNLITRLKKVAQGIKDGKPISSFTDELAEITRRITPKTETK